MSKPKLTEWFSPEVTPTIAGWYERDWDDHSLSCLADWWNGKEWCVQRYSGDPAMFIGLNDKRWRGLAEKP